jgi:hypothetical protein
MGNCCNSEKIIRADWRHPIEEQCIPYTKLYPNIKNELREAIADKFGYNYMLYLIDQFTNYIIRIGVDPLHKFVYVQQIDSHGYSTVCKYWNFGIGVKGFKVKRDTDGIIVDMTNDYKLVVNYKVPFPDKLNAKLNLELPSSSENVLWFGIPINPNDNMNKTNMDKLATPSAFNRIHKNTKLMNGYPYPNGLTSAQIRKIKVGIDNHIYDTI